MPEFSLVNFDFTAFLQLMRRSCQPSPVWSPDAVTGAPGGSWERPCSKLFLEKPAEQNDSTYVGFSGLFTGNMSPELPGGRAGARGFLLPALGPIWGAHS